MRRWIKRISLSILAAVLILTALITLQMQMGNFHEVIPGEFYRAAQPSPADLEHYVKRHGIKTVLNLRGGNPNDAWYREEVATSKALGLNHIDFRMKAARELTDEQAMELITIMRDAPKPLLIHCRAGADRTGLAAALYVAGIAKGSEWESEYQLSLRYGHVPLWFRDSAAMRRTFERLEPLLGFPNS